MGRTFALAAAIFGLALSSAAKADMKVDAKLNNTAMNSMDTNGDGMVSSRELNRYQTAMWKSMKPAKNGMVPMTDVEMMMGTPK